MIRTGGSWDPTDRQLMFLAADVHALNVSAVPLHPYVLVALNEIQPWGGGRRGEDKVAGWLEQGATVLLDSGVYNLARIHARKHGLQMSQAFATPPTELDGFGRLFDRYVELTRRYQDRLWGYIEVDFGGPAGKTATRRRLEALGLRPIPVFHPLSDPWSYFHHLASRYDRVCVGNLVQLPYQHRKRMLASITEHRQAHPGLWIHALGLSPTTHMLAYPVESTDTSAWLAMRRGMDNNDSQAALHRCGRHGPEWMYLSEVPHGDPRHYDRIGQFGATNRAFTQRTWRRILADLHEHLEEGAQCRSSSPRASTSPPAIGCPACPPATPAAACTATTTG